MKKLITSIAALVLFVGLTSAAETTATITTAEKNANSLGVLSSRSLTAIIEENVALRMKVEEMTETSDNLQSKLDYSNMMHSTLTNLKQKEIETIEENRKDQLGYAQMMTTTLLSLNTVLANAK